MTTQHRKCRPISVLLLSACAFLASAHPGLASASLPGRKVALVVGSQDYGGFKVSGKMDATQVAELLRQLDFVVLDPVIDGTLATWETALVHFEESIKSASLVVFFYSGHGFQINQQNFLLPRDGDIQENRALSMERVLNAVGKAPEGTPKLLFINACRDKVPEDIDPTHAEPPALGPGVMQSFAASPNQLARSGIVSNNERSPFALAFLKYFGQPGLRLVDTLTAIHDNVFTQHPSQEPRAWGFEGMKDLYVREPVTLDVVAQEFDDGLSVVLNGDVVLDSSAGKGARKTVQLRAGRNDLAIVVSNGASFDGGQSWRVTEGWTYRVRLFTAGGMELTLPEDQFAACEHHPFKNGPHHGGIFQVAKTELYVDPGTAEVEIREPQTKLFEKTLPYFAQDQGTLYSRSLRALGFQRHPKLEPYFNRLEIIRKILSVVNPGPLRIPDTDTLFAQVHGNYALRNLVARCMEEPDRLAQRQEDAALSIETLVSNPAETRPFRIFDRGLSSCVRELADEELKEKLGPSDLLIWTAFSSSDETVKQDKCVMQPN